MLNSSEIKSFIREHGVPGFLQGFQMLLEGGQTLPNGVKTKPLDLKNLSIKELWEGTVGRVEKTFGVSQAQFLQEAGASLDHTAFPTVTEKLLASVTIDEYTNQGGIGDSLVTDEYTPKTLTERIPGMTMAESPKPVMPGEEYPSLGFGDKYVTFEEALNNKKEGFLISVTEEVIRFDQTGMILRRARGAGETLGTEKERRTIRACLGIGLDTGTTIGGVYYPSGVDTPLYRASEYNYRTNSTPIYNHPGKTADSKLEDYTDLQEVMTIHAQNIRDDRLLSAPRPIVWAPNTILTPVSLMTIAGNIFTSQGVTYITNLGDTTHPEVRNNVANPLNMLFRGAVPTPYASAYVDEVTTTGWVVFDNRRTFLRVNIFPFQVYQSPADFGWNRDCVFAVRVREWSRVVAKEFRTAIFNSGS